MSSGSKSLGLFDLGGGLEIGDRSVWKAWVFRVRECLGTQILIGGKRNLKEERDERAEVFGEKEREGREFD